MGQGVQRFVPIVIVDVTISNPGIATGRVSYSESAFTAMDNVGLLYGPADAGRYEICEIEDVAEPPFRSGELRPGEEVRGRLVFHVEPGLRLETLRWHRTPSSEPVMAPLRLPTVIC